MRITPFLLVGALPCLSACATLGAAMDIICLDDALTASGYSRDDLETVDLDGDGRPDGDDVMKEVLALAAVTLGDGPVLDCAARDAGTSFSDAVIADAGLEIAEPGLPDKARPGVVVEAGSPGELPDKVEEVVQQGPGKGADVVVLIDTTGSMWDDTEAVVKHLKDIRAVVTNKGGRMAVAWYGDNMGCDDPWYGRNSSGLVDPQDTELQRFADAALEDGLSGGCDWPESMYDAIYRTADELNWESADRSIVVITDADALTGDRTNHSQDAVSALLDQKRIALDLIYTAVTY